MIKYKHFFDYNERSVSLAFLVSDSNAWWTENNENKNKGQQ